MSSVCKEMSFRQEAVWRVREQQGAQGPLTSSKGPGRMGIHHHEQGTAFPSRGISYLSKNASVHDCLCVQNKKNSLCRLKINHASWSKSCEPCWMWQLPNLSPWTTAGSSRGQKTAQEGGAREELMGPLRRLVKRRSILHQGQGREVTGSASFQRSSGRIPHGSARLSATRPRKKGAESLRTTSCVWVCLIHGAEEVCYSKKNKTKPVCNVPKCKELHIE